MMAMTIVPGAHTESNVCTRPLAPSGSLAFMASEALFLSGCGGAPSVTIAGAYFPVWLLCAVIAVLVAVVVRSLIVATGLSPRIPYQLAVCSSIGIIVALVVWQLWVVH